MVAFKVRLSHALEPTFTFGAIAYEPQHTLPFPNPSRA